VGGNGRGDVVDGGALQAFLTPDAGQYGLWHFRPIQTLTAHGLIITEGVYMTVVEGYRPTLRSFRNVFVYGNIAMCRFRSNRPPIPVESGHPSPGLPSSATGL